MANKCKYLPLRARAGVDKDNTSLYTQHYTDATGVRFYDGLPRKLGGNVEFTFTGGSTISDCPRTIYSQNLSTRIATLIGTFERLYVNIGGDLVNITPLETGTTAIANSLDTNYRTLGSNPAAMVNGSATVTITSTAHKLQAGDIVDLSGFSGTINGIPSAELNASHIVRTTTVNAYTIQVSTAANATGSGGGASVVEATSIITVNQAAHGYANGDRIKIASAATTGGIPNTEINAEHIIRNVTTNTYDIYLTTQATSSVTGGGGAGTTVQGQIAPGNCDGGAGIGYGMGRYGVGRYGTSKTSSNNITRPRIWSFAPYGNNVVMTPGGQTGSYMWTGSTATAPAPITNAPTTIDYIFESNNIVVTLSGRTVQWCDQGQITVWTSSFQNQAGDDDVEGSGAFVAHATARNGEILFTNGPRLFLMQYVGRPLVWAFTPIDIPDGIIAQNACVSVNGIVYWMGNNNLWRYNGGIVEPIPSNSETGHNYTRRYMFGDINTAQATKSFVWYNPIWDELWFHWPSSTASECDRVIRYSIAERHFTPDSLSRTAAEGPFVSNIYPRLTAADGTMYRHELGLNDNSQPLNWSLTFPKLQIGADLVRINGIIPDATQVGTIDAMVAGRPYSQSDNVLYAQPTGIASATPATFPITPTTGRVSMQLEARTLEVTLSQTNVTNGNFIMGAYNFEIEQGSERMALS